MPSYIVLGAGLMGEVAARYLLESENDTLVTLVDIDEPLLDKAADRVASDRLTVKPLNIANHDAAVEAIKGHDAAVDCLPIHLSTNVMKAAIDAGVSLTGLNGEHPEEKLDLDEDAREAGIVIIPGIGVAPGLSHVLVARGVELFDETENAVIYVGGLPREKGPPLDYRTVFSLDSVFFYYTEPVHIFRGGVETTVGALTGLETVEFPEPIGTLEAFYTDGLTSLTRSMKGKIKGHLAEKTLRYPGHVEKITFLEACGLLEKEPLSTPSGTAAPRDVLIAQLAPRLELHEPGDLIAMRVVVEGMKNGVPATHVFELIDYMDRITGYTAMARTTSFPAACAARMTVRGEIPERGVRFPEEIFTGDRFDVLLRCLDKQGVTITHTVRRKKRKP